MQKIFVKPNGRLLILHSRPTDRRCFRKYVGWLHSCQEVIVEDNHGCHCFNNGNGTWQDACIVSSARLDGGLVSVDIHGLLLLQDGGDRLEGDPEVDVLPVGDTCLDAPE